MLLFHYAVILQLAWVYSSNTYNFLIIKLNMDKPLTSNDLALIDREGEKIKSALSQLIKNFPLSAQNITGMSQWLEASKTTCQRIVESIQRPSNGIEAIQNLPGPTGLKKFIALVQQQKVTPLAIKSALDAIEHFESLIHKYARSHSALKQLLINSNAFSSAEHSDLELRKSLYESCTQITGESVDINFYAFIHKENDEDPKYLSQYILTYYEGCALAANSRPLRFPINPTENEVKVKQLSAVDITHQFQGQVPPFTFIKDFTSEKVLSDIGRMTIGKDFVALPSQKHSEELAKVAVLKHYPEDLTHPNYGGKMAGLSAVEIRFPSKKLYFLVFLENKLAMQSIANPGIYSSGLHLGDTPEDIWYDRFYSEADVSVFPANSNLNKKLNFDKANELVDSLFSLTKSNKNDFYGYFVEVDYPIWSTTYRLYFPSSID